VARAAGFSLHAGVAAEAYQRDKLERLCRYIARPTLASERWSRLADGRIRYELKTPYRDGTTHVIFEPLDFLARLAALVPSPGVNLTRYHGVFAPNHRSRALIVPARRGRGGSARAGQGSGAPPKHVAMTWAQRLKRVFGIQINSPTFASVRAHRGITSLNVGKDPETGRNTRNDWSVLTAHGARTVAQ
jgi:hypothetical protein